ncbi:uncharacterized protein LOC133711365 [Rosa rugosa]|uniref:uncharacterized protein LOC133711365 n=1 Tax=Rosa rugosa TaxID=74645 RepID=UPI002B400A24|nr:uncharacterized protein LOC133711365 [Rosa rugosa]
MDKPAHFDPKFKCDILLNNHSESFNKSILPARKKPILSCLEDIRAATMLRVISSSDNIFEIQGRGVACASGLVAAHSVSLDARTCTCKRWDISGVPCGHAVAAIHSKGMRPDDFVHEYFTMDTYMKAYEPILFPIAGVAEWDKIHRPIPPPLYRRQPGRPKMSRNKEPGEVAPPTGAEKLPKVYYQQIACGIRKKKGHNRRTCKVRNQQGENVQQQQQEDEAVQQPENEEVLQQDPQEVDQVEPQDEYLPLQHLLFSEMQYIMQLLVYIVLKEYLELSVTF